MNLLMVYPEFPDTFWSFKHALRFIHKKASSPPLGLMTIAAMLPKAWTLKLVDLNVETLKDKDIQWADYVFLSAMVVQRESVYKAIEHCKQLRATIIAGGPLFTGEYDNFQGVDHFVLNEAEITLPLFLKDLENGEAKKVYATDKFADITQTPVPMWNLVKREKYDSMCIQFSRGCPFNCEFCNITALLGHVPRTKTREQIITELDALYQLGWRRNIFFVDDNFIGNRKALKQEILPAIIEWRKGKETLRFITEASINLADDEELMDMMAEAGFTSVFVGIETPDEAGLKECNKSQNTRRDLVACVKRMQNHGLQVMGGFIVGFDSDTPTIFQRQIEFIQTSGIVTAMVGLLQAPYGTSLYRRLKTDGRVLDEFSGDNVDGSTNIIPKMDINVLRDGYQKIMKNIYSSDLFYERVKNFLREYNPPKMPTTIEFQEIMALFRSIYRLGIKSVERLYYWKLFFWTLFHYPKKFPMAITLSIYGFHFRKVCEQQGIC